jgi:glyoxylase-like metal-dependent hydrolase (beta-lactamase superfamily II)
VPGHTSGSIAFYSEQDGFVLTGDALFAGSIGRTDLPGGNFETLLYSIRSNLLTLPPETVVYPGHGGKTTIRHEKSANPYLI